MKTRMPATEARVHFGELLRRVTERGESVIVEHRGTTKIAFLSLPEYERRTEQPLAEHLGHGTVRDAADR